MHNIIELGRQKNDYTNKHSVTPFIIKSTCVRSRSLLNVKVSDRKDRISDCCNVSIITNENYVYNVSSAGVVVGSIAIASFSRDDAPDDEPLSATAPSDEIG